MNAPATTLPASRARLTCALDGKGKRAGHIVLPWSRDDSGWGSLRVPIGIVSSGPGPTVLLTGGNHGDEIEGPVALVDLFRGLEPDRLHGTVIILPALNYPAVKAGRRLSPIDGGNMNRAFRGRHDGTLTEQVAHFVEEALVARADAVLDIHAGGRTMMFHPFAVSHRLPSPEQTARARAALVAFGAPIGLVLEELDSEGMLDTAVERRGKLFLSTELGGGGTTTPDTLAIARRGVRNFLVHTGVLDGAVEAPAAPTRLMTNDADGYADCPGEGLIEYLVDLAAEVTAGQPIARLHDIDRLGAPAIDIAAPATGLLIGRLHGGIARAGDFAALVARDL